MYTSPDFVKGPPASPSSELSLSPSLEPSASPSLLSTSTPSPDLFRYVDEDSGGSTSAPSWIISSRISSCARSLRIGLGGSILSAKCELHIIFLSQYTKSKCEQICYTKTVARRTEGAKKSPGRPGHDRYGGERAGTSGKRCERGRYGENHGRTAEMEGNGWPNVTRPLFPSVSAVRSRFSP